MRKRVLDVSLSCSFVRLFVCFVCFSDILAPSFGVTCPSGPLLAYARRDSFSALVNWTEPVATDNSGVKPRVTSNYQSPQWFSQGTHEIRSTAVDQSGNKATCVFTVTVIGNEMLKIFLNSCYG